MELWVGLTIMAAFVQNIRSALQKHLKGRLGTLGATLVRFLYGWPFAVILLVVMARLHDSSQARLDAAFAAWVTLAALGQVVAQVLLIAAFAHRNFTAASAYSRTEPIHAALIGFVVIGDRFALSDLAAIALAVAGVTAITLAGAGDGPRRGLAAGFLHKGALYGLASGVTFGFVAVAYRAAALALDLPSPLLASAITLTTAITLQVALLGAYMALRARGELLAVLAAWRPGLAVGLAGATASFGWFAAMAMQPAGIIKALAQIEMLFTYAATVLVFRERVSPGEIAGCVLIVAAILVLLLL